VWQWIAGVLCCRHLDSSPMAWNFGVTQRSQWYPRRIQDCEFAKECVTPRSAVALLGLSESGEEIALNHINVWKDTNLSSPGESFFRKSEW
jgi:hypothetical protein